MPFYASQWQGVGTRADPFRPVATPAAGVDWRVIDLRADPSIAGGYCLVWTATALSPVPTGVWLLADTPDSALSGSVRSRISSLLAVPALPNGTTFRQAVRRLMTTDATGQTNGRWKPLANVSGTYRLTLGTLEDSWAAGG